MNFSYTSKRLRLVVLTEDSAVSVLNFLDENRELFEPYETSKPDNYYTADYQAQMLKYEGNAFLKGNYIRFYVYLNDNIDEIIGTVSFSNILKYPFNTANIGYKFSSKYHHNGYATEAVLTAICAVFRDSSIHRLEAYVLPDNKASISLLNRIGFTNEGLCHQIICINNKYLDHYRFALVNTFTN